MRAVSLAVFLSVGLAGRSFAQPSMCDPNITEQKQGISYRLRTTDHPRCEGLYKVPVGSVPMEIVSFTRGSLGTLATGRPVFVELATPDHRAASAAVPGLVHIRATAVPIGINYRLDSRIEETEAMRWPLDDVVVPAGLKLSQIGILAFQYSAAGSLIYLPVAVAHGDPPSRPDYIIRLRRTGTVTSPDWSLSPPASPSGGSRSKLDGDQLELEIVSDGPPEDRQLTITWNDLNGSPRVRQFRLRF